MGDRFHKVHQRTEAGSDGNPAFQSQPGKQDNSVTALLYNVFYGAFPFKWIWIWKFILLSQLDYYAEAWSDQQGWGAQRTEQVDEK